MRHLLILLGVSWCFCTTLLAQAPLQLSGTIVNSSNNQPLPFASVFLKNVYLGTVSDENGRFRLTIPAAQADGVLQVSYVGFQTKELAIGSIQDPKNVRVQLVVEATVLDAAIVKAPKRYTAKEVMRKALRSIENNYSTNPVYLGAYYRETITENGRHIKYADAVCDYHYMPYREDKFKYRDYETTWGYSGTMSFLSAYWGERLHRGHFHVATLKSDQVKILASRSSDNFTARNMNSNIEGGPLGLLGKDRVKFRAYFMDKGNWGKYNYTLTEEVDPTDERWKYVVHFTPDVNLDKWDEKDKGKWKIRNRLLAGKVYVDRTSFAITGMEYSVQPELKKHICGYEKNALKHFDYHVRIDYQKVNGKWYLQHLRLEDEFIYDDTITNVRTPYRAVSEVFINEVRTDSVRKYPLDDVLHNWDGNQLFDHPLVYDTAFWEQHVAEHPEFAIPANIRQDMEEKKVLEHQFAAKHEYNENMEIPVAPKKPQTITLHKDVRVDDYAWMKDTIAPQHNAEVMDYLKAENAYADNYCLPVRAKQRNLFKEMSMLIERKYESLPTKKDGYLYYLRYEKEDEYATHFRKKMGSEKEDTILNVPKMAEKYEYYSAGGITVSPNTWVMGYYENTKGGDNYLFRFTDLETGKRINDSLVNVGSVIWIDNQTLLYTLQEKKTNRMYQIKRHTLMTPQEADELIYEEVDAEFGVSLERSKSKEFIFLNCGSSASSEVHYVRTNNPYGAFKIIHPREENHKYNVQHFKEHFYISSDQSALNYKVMLVDTVNPGYKNWRIFIPEKRDVLLSSLTFFNNYYVVGEIYKTIPRLRVVEWATGKEHYIDQKEKISSAAEAYNPDYNTDTLQYAYSSYSTPGIVYNYHMGERKRRLVKQQKTGGLKYGKIKSKMVWAPARDGKLIPITLIYRSWGMPLDPEKSRVFLTAYGAYGAGNTPAYSPIIYSYISRGIIYAIAHVRGGNDLGMGWHEDGKMLKKKNSFNDFIDCAEYLVAKEKVGKGNIIAKGESAGGLLMGAVANARPDLFKAIFLDVPFVDALNTMMDDQLPLTTGEYQEWGNPNEKKYYNYIKSYSPYDNVKRQDYPALYFFTGLSDQRVGYWEPAKMVAKLRDYKTDDNVILLKTNLHAGHGGASGRYAGLRESAFQMSLIFDLFERQMLEVTSQP